MSFIDIKIPKLSIIKKGVLNTFAFKAKPSVKGVWFHSDKPAPAEESFIIALFKSDINPDDDVSQNISNKLSTGLVS